MNNPAIHTCPDCGWVWAHGAHGGHSCVSQLTGKLEVMRAKLEVAEAALRAQMKDEPDAVSIYFMHDNHTFTRLHGSSLDEILAHADRVESGPSGSYGGLCPIHVKRGAVELRRVGTMAHSGHPDAPKDKWNEGKAKWREAAESDPDVVRLLALCAPHP